MKRLLMTIFLVSLLLAGCGNNDNDIDNNIKEIPETIIEDEVIDTESDTESIIVKPTDTDIAIGLESPDFTLLNLEGEELSLSDYRDKIVLINFWATWCHWCDLEMPDLNKLDEENDDVVVLAINVMEDEKTIIEYIEKNDLGFQVVLDTEGDLTAQYLVDGLPNSYFVDKEGILQLRYRGALTYDQMIGIIDSIRNLDS